MRSDDALNPFAAPGDPGWIGSSAAPEVDAGPFGPHVLPPDGRPRRPWWHYLGLALAIAAVIAGLAAIAFFILMAVALNEWANNK